MSELYLSRLVLDPHRREVWLAAADCHRLHRAVLAAFPDAAGPSPREAFGLLHRLELDPDGRAPTLLVQSAVVPDWSRPGSAGGWSAERARLAVKEVGAAYAALAAGDRLRFRLRANPTKRVHADRDDPLAGKRVDLRDEDARLAWLGRKGEQHGFAVVAAEVRPGSPGNRDRGRPGDGAAPVAFGAALFEGVLEVAEAAAFGAALREGVGPGKAFGFGLLSVARAR